MNLFGKIKTTGSLRGFVVLNIALIIGGISIIIALSIAASAIFQTQTASSRQDAARAQNNAETCIEKAIYELTKDIHRYGSYTYNLIGGGACDYFYTGGTGNTNRIIQSRATVGSSTRLKEAKIIQVQPVLRIAHIKNISALSEIEVVRGENLALWLSAQDTSTLSLSRETIRTWLDKSLFKNHASQNQKEKQPVYVSRIDNRPGVLFNGTNNFLQTQDSESLRISGEISLSVWVRIGSANESEHKILQRNHPSGHSEDSTYALIILQSGEDYRVDLQTQSCVGPALKAEGPIIPGNKWVHLLVTYSETDELVRFYVDGSLATETFHSGQICGDAGGTLEIGGNSTDSKWFDGYVDDIRLYNTIINSDEALKIYTQTIPGHILTIALSNLSLWFDASEYETLTIESNNKVSNWKDRIKDTIFLDQNADSDRPLYTASVGGKEGLDFDGGQTYLSMPTDPSTELTDEITISAWVRPREGASSSSLIHKKSTTNPTTNSLYAVELESDKSIVFRTFDCLGNANAVVGPVIPANRWSHVAATYSNTLNTVRMFIDGELKHFDTSYEGEICNEEGNLEIGGFSGHAIGKWFDGFIGEVRLYDAALSSRHIKGIYDETVAYLNIPANWHNDNWPHRNAITLKSSQVVENLTNFPALINSTREEWKHVDFGGGVSDLDGTDILFASEDGQTKLDHEIDFYDPNTGKLVAWVKIPSVPSSADTSLYVYYGNDTATDQQNAIEVWSDYEAVWHFNELLASDVTGNGFNITNTINSPTVISGKNGQAIEYARSNQDGSVFNSSFGSLLSGSNAYSLTGYVKITSGNNANSLIWHPRADHDVWLLADGSKLEYGILSNDAVYRANATISANTWYHIAVTFDPAGAAFFYIDGDLKSEIPAVNPDPVSNTQTFGLASLDGLAHSWGALDGAISEFRIKTGILSDGWIATESNNQNSPETFYSLEKKESL